jgi:uncharacterized membrane protein
MLPPWPGWDGLHPLVIHFPVALLLIAPVFLVLSAISARHATGFSVSALILLAIGTTAAYVAVETGEAAAELADRTEAITAGIMRHQTMADRTVLVFTAITVTYAILLVLPLLVKRLAARRARVIVAMLMLVAVLGGGLQVAATAHQGGMLVHRLGVHAMQPPEPVSK